MMMTEAIEMLGARLDEGGDFAVRDAAWGCRKLLEACRPALRESDVLTGDGKMSIYQDLRRQAEKAERSMSAEDVRGLLDSLRVFLDARGDSVYDDENHDDEDDFDETDSGPPPPAVMRAGADDDDDGEPVCAKCGGALRCAAGCDDDDADELRDAYHESAAGFFPAALGVEQPLRAAAAGPAARERLVSGRFFSPALA